MGYIQVIETEPDENGNKRLYLSKDYTVIKIDTDTALSLKLTEFKKLKDIHNNYNLLYKFAKNDIVKLKRLLQSTKNTNKLYSGIAELEVKTDFKQIRQFSKSMLNLLETINNIAQVNLFTKEKRKTFIKNLRTLLRQAGYNLFITEYSGDTILFRIEFPAEGKYKVYKLDATSYNKLERTTYLKNIIDDLDTLLLLDPYRIELILEDLELFRV